MVWPSSLGQNGDPRDPRDDPEFLRQMEELRQREQAALQRQVRHFYSFIFQKCFFFLKIID